MNRREFLLAGSKAAMAAALINSGMKQSLHGALAPADNGARFPGAINSLGLDLLSTGIPDGQNALLSPLSIQVAFAMAWAGVDGATREEMTKVLHYPADESWLDQSYQELQHSLDEIVRDSAERSEQAREYGDATDPITIAVANRLFGQQGYAFRQPFLDTTKTVFNAPLETLDFRNHAEPARKTINDWVEERTRQRIKDLIPPDGVNKDTRLVLVNAIFLKAPWLTPFSADATKQAPFHLAPGQSKNVPTMRQVAYFGYARQNGFTVVTMPYGGGKLQFLILLPDPNTTAEALQAKLSAKLLVQSGKAPGRKLILHVPKFKLEPELIKLSRALKKLGMHTAFDVPQGTANFDRMAPRRPDDYLHISEAFHKTFLSLDEKGTEAAAATAVSMIRGPSALAKPQEPIEVHVDRPFIFAVQHRPTGACIFLGRLHNPS